MMDGGSNNLIVGEVVATKTAGEIEGADPLLYFAREYHRLK
jgi:flavin reductase (DIM6/NTAB) family NADH-FMN oxidoreductase RutF